ncbi:MAG: DNA repair protein RecO, partial [Patescibacteria group bacterium]|nr:DNA repair protein RecO [Patescibacteria group bacterium]
MAFKTEAFVLRSRPWRRADRLYELFTPEEGLLSVICRSAAKSESKLAGHLLPFSKVKVMIGRGRFDHLAGVKTIYDFKNIRSDLRSLSLAGAIAELFLYDHSRGSKIKEFSLLGSVFSFLDDAVVDSEKKSLLVRSFLWKYLSLLGWQPQLNHCLICQKNISSGQYMSGRGIIGNEHQVGALEVSDDLLDFLRFILEADWPDLLNLK